MTNIILPKPEYNPFRLPERIDFHKQTQEFPLPKGKKRQFQIKLSKMSKEKVKETIKNLKQMAYDCLNEKVRLRDWENIDKKLTAKNYKKLPDKLKEDFKMAIYCKFCAEFAEKYLESLEKQKKV